MRSFLRTTLIFLIGPVSWFVGMAVWNLHFLGEEDPGIHAHAIAIGDSHIVCDLDTAMLPGVQNIGSTAEPLLLSWWKLRYVQQHHRIDTVILGVGPHNLSAKSDERLLKKGWATEELMRRLYGIVPFDEALRAPIHLGTYLGTLFERLCVEPHKRHLEFYDGFTGVRRSFRSNADSVLQRHYYNEDGHVAAVSRTAEIALDSIRALCARQGIMLYVVGTPVHESYLTGIPIRFRVHYDSLAQETNASSVHFLDYLTAYQGDSLFADSDHLNHIGARLFSAGIDFEIRGRPKVLSASQPVRVTQ